MKYHILSKEIYEEKLADLLQRREGSSNIIYMDGKGLPTISIGYALMFDNHEPRNIEDIKADMKKAMNPEDYVQIQWSKVHALLKNIQEDFKYGHSKESIKHKIEDYNKNESNRPLHLSTKEQKKLLVETSLPHFEKQLDNTLTKHLPYSNERVAAISQLYRLGSAPSMIKAINEGNRAEAWYQIRYNSNGDQLKGNYGRVIEESDLFGLYDKYPNAKNEKDIKEMFHNHASKIEQEEKKSPLYQKSNEEHGYNLDKLSQTKETQTPSPTNGILLISSEYNSTHADNIIPVDEKNQSSSLLPDDVAIPNTQIAEFDTNESTNEYNPTQTQANEKGAYLMENDILLSSEGYAIYEDAEEINNTKTNDDDYGMEM